MLVSVIIPLYNSQNTFKKCICSVISQKSYDIEIEIILVDDCSIDKAYLEDIPLLFHDQKHINFIIVEHELNKGVGYARNTGIKHANGEYIALLDSDDYWLPNKLIKQIDLFTIMPNVVMIGSLTTMPQSRLPLFSNNKCKGIYINTIQQCLKNYFQPSTVVIRKSVFNSFEWSTRRDAEEGEVFLNLLIHGDLYLLNEVLVDYSGGKQGFGISGLSSKIKFMHDGELKNLYNAYKRGQFNFVFFFILFTYSYLKYFRRFLLTKLS
jgi:glycosyltransferase involved in cell wall biosynthesis